MGELLKSKRQEVAQRVLNAGFDARDFRFEDQYDRRENWTVLAYKAEPYWFEFRERDEGWRVSYSPGEHQATDQADAGIWAYVLTRVDWWLSYLRREIDVLDPWRPLDHPGSIGLGSDDAENTPFTSEEQTKLAGRLAEIRTALLDSAAESDADRHFIAARLDRIESGLGRLGRLDWRSLAIGGLVDLALLGYVKGEDVRRCVDFLVGAAQQLLLT